MPDRYGDDPATDNLPDPEWFADQRRRAVNACGLCGRGG